MPLLHPFSSSFLVMSFLNTYHCSLLAFLSKLFSGELFLLMMLVSYHPIKFSVCCLSQPFTVSLCSTVLFSILFSHVSNFFFLLYFSVTFLCLTLNNFSYILYRAGECLYLVLLVYGKAAGKWSVHWGGVRST